MSDLTLSELLQRYDETHPTRNTSMGAIGAHRRWTDEIKRRGLTLDTLREQVVVERNRDAEHAKAAAEHAKLAAKKAEEEAKIAEDLAAAELVKQRRRRELTHAAIAICETTDEQLDTKNPTQKVDLFLELVPICRTLFEMDQGLAVELHTAFAQFVPRFQAACIHITFSPRLMERFEEACASLDAFGLHISIAKDPHIPGHDQIRQFKSEFSHAFSRYSGQSSAQSFQDVIDRFIRTMPGASRFLDDPAVMAELRAELVVDDAAPLITPADSELMGRFLDEFLRHAGEDPVMLFNRLLHKYRLTEERINHLIPSLRELTGVYQGKRMRQKQRSRRVNRRPKSKRYMKKNKTTKK
jgi:hypothetical protein